MAVIYIKKIKNQKREIILFIDICVTHNIPRMENVKCKRYVFDSRNGPTQYQKLKAFQ